MNENIITLLELIKENPELNILPMVDGEFCSDEFAYWSGVWGVAEVDEVYGDDERIYFRKYDEEELIENRCDDIYFEEFPRWEKTTESEDKKIEEQAKKDIAKLSWEKVITVKINSL